MLKILIMNLIIIEKIMLSIMIFISFRCLFDWIVYTASKAPKESQLSKRTWLIGWIFTIVLIYYTLNNFSWL